MGRASVPVLMVLAAMVVGCGSDSEVRVDRSTTPVVTDVVETDAGGEGPCGLLATSEVSDVTGQVMGDGVEVGGMPADTCEWISTQPSTNPEIISPMKVTLAVGDLAPGEAEELDEMDSPGQGFRVNGIGDDALMVCGLSADIGDGCASYGPLIVIIGERYVTVAISSFAWPDDLTQDQVSDGLQVLARLVVGRL